MRQETWLYIFAREIGLFSYKMINMNKKDFFLASQYNIKLHLDSRGRDRMVVGFTTTCAISAYHH
jgi:hypothetical protein